MKVRISQDELWPDYRIVEKYGHEVEATPEQVERWTKAAADYERARDEMGALWDAADDLEQERKAHAKAEREAAEKARQAEARANAERARKAQDARWERLKRDGGTVYDSAGNPIARLDRGIAGPTVRLIEDAPGQDS